MSPATFVSALPRRYISVLIAALFGLTLTLNPISAPQAEAAVSWQTGARALRVAGNQRGVPYVWGGTSRRGFDCSGLTQYAYRKAGKYIPRVAQDQYRATIHLRPGRQRPGDLVFFLKRGQVHHVGIYIGRGLMIVAPHRGTRVRTERIKRSKHPVFGRVR